jgi:hypothetical protein
MIEFKWKKLGRIFNPQDVQTPRPWMKEYAQAPHTLIFDDFVRVYFSCRPLPDENGMCVSYSTYLDLDRKDLTKIIKIATRPILPLGDLGTFDEFGTYIASPVWNKGEIWVYYSGFTRCVSVPFNVAIGLARSYDKGESFIKCGPGPVLSYSPDEPYILSGPKIRKFNSKWYLFYIVGRKWPLENGKPTNPVYKLRLAVSYDGVSWKKVGKDLIPSLYEDEAQSGPDVIYLDNKFHMFFCHRRSENYRGKEGGLRIGYASSWNLFDWERDDSKAGIDVSDEGWDSEMVRYPHVFELDGKVYMLYNGNNFGKYGFGLAVLE